MTSNITEVVTTAIPVSDQDDAIAFYVDKLGFEVRFDAEIAGRMRWIEVAPPGSRSSIALLSRDPDAAGDHDTGIRLLTSSAARDHEAFVRHGIDVSELLDWPGIPLMFSFRDPDGNRLYIVEPGFVPHA